MRPPSHGVVICDDIADKQEVVAVDHGDGAADPCGSVVANRVVLDNHWTTREDLNAGAIVEIAVLIVLDNGGSEEVSACQGHIDATLEIYPASAAKAVGLVVD